MLKKSLLLFSIILASTGWSQMTINGSATIGLGANTSGVGAKSGPIYRHNSASNIDHSQNYYFYSAAELSSAGINLGDSITSVAWNLTNNNGFPGSTLTNTVSVFQVYLENSTSSTTLGANQNFAIQSASATLVYSDSNQVITGVTGFVSMTFDTPFLYTGGALEIGVNWDCSAQLGPNATSGGFSWKQDAISSVCLGGKSTSPATPAVMSAQQNRPQIQFGYITTPCSGTPLPGNTVATADSVCPIESFTLSFQNHTVNPDLTYVWESADDSAFTTNVNTLNSTSYTHTLTQSETKWYRCTITCANNATSGVSSSVRVVLNNFLDCYCTSTAQQSVNEEISNVTIGTLSNSSSCTDLAPGPGSVISMYSNYKSGIGAPAPIPVAHYDTISYSFTQTSCNTQNFNIFKCFIDYNHNGSFSDPGELVHNGSFANGNQTDVGTFIIPVSSAVGITAVRVVNGNGFSCGSSTYGETEDYLIDISPGPPCTEALPGNTISSVPLVCAGQSFNLTLENSPDGSGVIYLWQSADDSLFTLNVAALSSNDSTQQINSQLTAKYYRCIVTCSNGPIIANSNPVFVDVSTGSACYCTPTTTNGCSLGDVIAKVVLNTLNNDSGTGCPSGTIGYSDYTGDTSLTTTLVAGNSYNCQVWTGEWEQNFMAWIDFNNDGVFSNGTSTDIIGYTLTPVSGSGIPGTLGSNATFAVSIPCSAAPGTYRLRIRAMYDIPTANPMTPCGNNNFGEVEDYLVTIVQPLPCPPPSLLQTSNQTGTTIDLNWTAGCVETAWNIEYGPTGFALGTGTTIGANSSSTSVYGLSCGTNYDFYVYADCGLGGSSTPSLVASSSTLTCSCNNAPAPGNTEASSSSVCDSTIVSLSLQNDVSAVGISYLWESSTDISFITPVVLGTNSTETGLVYGDTWFRCKVTCSGSGITTASAPVLVIADSLETVGNDMVSAIFIPSINCLDSAYIDTINTLTECYSNNYTGTASLMTKDVWYTFTLTSESHVGISLCGSAINGYIRLLNNFGGLIQDNEGNGPACSGPMVPFNQFLSAGTYFIVVQGYPGSFGEIVTNVSTGLACNACDYPMVLDSPVVTTSTSANVTFTPSAQAGIAWYEFRYRIAGTTPWIAGGTSNSTVSSKLLSGLAPNSTYEVQARSLCNVPLPFILYASWYEDDFVGGWSPIVVFTTPILQGCALPPAMSATPAGSSITISWPAITNAGWYEFQYKESSSSIWLSAGSATGTATSKLIAGLTPGTSYDIQSRTVCTNGVPSIWGAGLTISTLALAGCESPPILDLVAVTSLNTIHITWPAVSGAAWYTFQYKESSSSVWISGGSATGSATSKTYAALIPGTAYEFQAKTYCPSGAGSAWSITGSYLTDGAAFIASIDSINDKATDLEDKSLTAAKHITNVYPNPAMDEVNVEIWMEAASENSALRLLDMNGRLAREVSLETIEGINTLTMDLQGLSDGLYTMHVYQNGSLMHTAKVKKK